jgi:hypothetical protein
VQARSYPIFTCQCSVIAALIHVVRSVMQGRQTRILIDERVHNTTYCCLLLRTSILYTHAVQGSTQHVYTLRCTHASLAETVCACLLAANTLLLLPLAACYNCCCNILKVHRRAGARMSNLANFNSLKNIPQERFSKSFLKTSLRSIPCL